MRAPVVVLRSPDLAVWPFTAKGSSCTRWSGVYLLGRSRRSGRPPAISEPIGRTASGRLKPAKRGRDCRSGPGSRRFRIGHDHRRLDLVDSLRPLRRLGVR